MLKCLNYYLLRCCEKGDPGTQPRSFKPAEGSERVKLTGFFNCASVYLLIAPDCSGYNLFSLVGVAVPHAWLWSSVGRDTPKALKGP